MNVTPLVAVTHTVSYPHPSLSFDMRCLGCESEFLRIRRHFLDTNNPACLEFAQRIRDTAFNLPLEPPSTLESNSSIEHSHAPKESSAFQSEVNNEFGDVTMTFEAADLFDHQEQMFLNSTPSPPAFPINNSNVASDDSDSEIDTDAQDETDLYHAECENAWEEPVEMVDLGLPLTPDVETVTLPLDSNRLQLPAALIGSSPISNLPSVQASRPHIVYYPNRHSGAPVPGRDAGNSDREEYNHKLNGRGNLWAPFKSELDWRLARWAKMRGPGSTAFTELLDIPGVSVYSIH